MPFELRRLALGLLMNGTMTDPGAIAAEAVCMAIAARSADKGPALATALQEINQALDRPTPIDRVNAFRQAVASRVRARPDLAQDLASLNVLPKEQRQPGTTAAPDAAKDPTRTVLDEIAALRAARKSRDPDSLAARERQLADIATRNGGANGELAGAVFLVRAEDALSTGSLKAAEQLIREANNTALGRPASGFDDVYADARARLNTLNGLFAIRRNAAQGEAKALAVDDLLGKRGQLGPLALAYRRTLDLALEAEDYPTI